MSERLRSMPAPRGREVSDDAATFLRQLGGPVAMHVPGTDGTRTRAVSTLLHGNEPSGLIGVQRWLRAERTPACDTLLIVASVDTALAVPGFAHRMLPGHRDLNRCFFGPFDDPVGRLARQILDTLRDARPDALVDVHNNTGHNPPYGVGADASPACRGLVSLFGRRFVHSRLRLGAIVEATAPLWPSVTVECGRAGDPAADQIAFTGLSAFLEAEMLPDDAKLEMLSDPVRVCLAPGRTLAFGDAPDATADLTVRTDIDRHNFERLAAGTAIGWLHGSGGWPVVASDAQGKDVSRELFEARDGVLLACHELVPIMMTTDREIAMADCLFYAVEPESDTD